MMPIEPDHYGVLELKPGSPMEDVKSQYRRLAKRYHPDLHGNDAASQEKFRRVNAAYTFLSDAPRKASYDAVLQVARKIGAPPLKAAPPPIKAAPPSPMATGHHASVPATGFHEDLPPDVRMTRSAWLGATAGLVLVMLVIGLSLDGSGPGHSGSVEATSPLPAGNTSGSALGNGSAGNGSAGNGSAGNGSAGNGSEPGADPLSAIPPFAAATAGTTPHAVHSVSQTVTFPPAHISMVGRKKGPPHVLASDVPALRAADEMRRIRPAFASLSRGDMFDNLKRKTQLTPKNSRRLASVRRPIRDDIQALSKVSAAFHLAPHAPARTTLTVSAPVPAASVEPAPSLAPMVPETPKPTDASAVKPKAPASPGQEFIMWGK